MGVLRLGDREVPLRCRHIVGRERKRVDLHLPQPFVSSEHAELIWRPSEQGWAVADLHSRNGTYVNETRLGPGTRRSLRSGDQVAFGERVAPWVLHCESPPLPFAVPLLGGDVVLALQGRIELPGATLLYQEAGVWQVQDSGQLVGDDDELELLGRRWLLCLREASQDTTLLAEDSASISQISMELRISRDLDDIEVWITVAGVQHQFPHRNHHYLLHYLAQDRLRDQKSGLAAGDSGWVDREMLLSDLKIGKGALDQYVHRCRAQLQDIGVRESVNVIERRRGSVTLRLGVSQLSVVPR